MSIPTERRVWTLANPPIGAIKPDTFQAETKSLPKENELKDGEMIVKVLALSNDPAQRGWMDGKLDERRMYVPLIKKGEAIRAAAVAEVVASKSDKFKKGTRVTGQMGWFDYAVVKDSEVRPAPAIEGMSEFISISGLGSIGLTAYFGVFEWSKLNKDMTVVVSGAAGAVGSLYIQIAKHIVGCKRVIGIAGGRRSVTGSSRLAQTSVSTTKPKDSRRTLPSSSRTFATSTLTMSVERFLT